MLEMFHWVVYVFLFYHILVSGFVKLAGKFWFHCSKLMISHCFSYQTPTHGHGLVRPAWSGLFWPPYPCLPLLTAFLAHWPLSVPPMSKAFHNLGLSLHLCTFSSVHSLISAKLSPLDERNRVWLHFWCLTEVATGPVPLGKPIRKLIHSHPSHRGKVQTTEPPTHAWEPSP